jgi:hypothetical protein
MQLLRNVWVNSKHQRHVHGCLQLASQQQQDVVDNQYFFDQHEAFGGRRSDVYISHVCIKKGEVKHLDLTSLSNDQVYEVIKDLGVGWFSCYSRYAAAMRRHGINGAMLKELGHDDLQELGIENRLHRRRIMLEIEALHEGRSWQTFDIFICSVGFSSDTQGMKSKEEVEAMLMNEIHNACSQLEDGGSAIGLEDSCPDQDKIVLIRDSSLKSLNQPMGKWEPSVKAISDAKQSDLSKENWRSDSNVASEALQKWSVGEEVLYYGNGRVEAPFEGSVTKLHKNGRHVKVEYDHPNGDRRVTPWVSEGNRLQRKVKEEVCD